MTDAVRTGQPTLNVYLCLVSREVPLIFPSVNHNRNRDVHCWGGIRHACADGIVLPVIDRTGETLMRRKRTNKSLVGRQTSIVEHIAVGEDSRELIIECEAPREDS